MKNELHNILGYSIDESIEHIVECFDKLELSIEQLEKYMQNIPELTKAEMHIIALSKGKKELAEKIDKTNKLIEMKRFNDFKKCVANGTYEEFLANMTWIDKSSLLCEMGLFRVGIPSEKPFTKEEQIYYDIIQSSIDDDLRKEVLSQGFDNVDEWRKNNARQAMNNGLKVRKKFKR